MFRVFCSGSRIADGSGELALGNGAGYGNGFGYGFGCGIEDSDIYPGEESGTGYAYDFKNGRWENEPALFGDIGETGNIEFRIRFGARQKSTGIERPFQELSTSRLADCRVVMSSENKSTLSDFFRFFQYRYLVCSLMASADYYSIDHLVLFGRLIEFDANSITLQHSCILDGGDIIDFSRFGHDRYSFLTNRIDVKIIHSAILCSDIAIEAIMKARKKEQTILSEDDLDVLFDVPFDNQAPDF